MRKRLEAWLFADADGAPALIRRLVTENARAFAPLYALAFVCMGLVAATTGARSTARPVSAPAVARDT